MNPVTISTANAGEVCHVDNHAGLSPASAASPSSLGHYERATFEARSFDSEQVHPNPLQVQATTKVDDNPFADLLAGRDEGEYRKQHRAVGPEDKVPKEYFGAFLIGEAGVSWAISRGAHGPNMSVFGAGLTDQFGSVGSVGPSCDP